MGFFRKQPGVVAFTTIEVAGVAAWLALVLGVVPLSPGAYGVGVTAAHIGLGVLFVSLIFKHVLADVTVNGIRMRNVSPSMLVVAGTETALWALWLYLALTVGGLAGIAVAGVSFALLLVPQHSIEDDVLRGRSQFSRLLDYWTLSVVEALGATAVLALLSYPALFASLGPTSGFSPWAFGVGLLAAFLYVEHSAGVWFVVQSENEPSEPRDESAVVQ